MSPFPGYSRASCISSPTVPTTCALRRTVSGRRRRRASPPVAVERVLSHHASRARAKASKARKANAADSKLGLLVDRYRPQGSSQVHRPPRRTSSIIPTSTPTANQTYTPTARRLAAGPSVSPPDRVAMTEPEVAPSLDPEFPARPAPSAEEEPTSVAGYPVTIDDTRTSAAANSSSLPPGNNSANAVKQQDLPNVSWEDIKSVQNLIERCLQKFMTQTEIIAALQVGAAWCVLSITCHPHTRTSRPLRILSRGICL